MHKTHGEITSRVGKSVRKALYATASFSALLSLPMAAYSQGSPAEVVEANSEARTLDAVVVTARKKEELEKDVPISMTAVSATDIEDKNLVQLEDFVLYVPNFRQSNGSIGPFRYVRGAGSGSNTSFEQAVGTFVDNVYVGRGQQSRLPFFDMERVEFLRGPQVLLYGNSTIAGAISATTKRPGKEFEADINASYEFEHQETILRGGVTIPISDRFRVRVAAFSQDLENGWLTSVNDGRRQQDPRFDNFAYRITAVADFTDNLTGTFKYEDADLGVRGNTLQSIGNLLNNPAITESNFDLIREVGQPAPLGIPEDRVDMDPKTLQGELVFSNDSITLTSLTAYTEYDLYQVTEGDLSPIPIFGFASDESYQQFSQEIRADGDFSDRFGYSIGAYYQKDDLKAVGYTDTNLAGLGTPVPPFARRNYLDQETESWSLFGELSFDITPQLTISAGARYMDIDKTIDQGARSADVGTGALNPLAEMIILPSPPFPPNTALYELAFGSAHDFTGITRSEDHFMPQLMVQYDFNPNVMGYFKYVEGAKAGGVDWLYGGNDPDEAQFLPEEANSFEIGVKSRLLSNTLQLDVTAFQTEFENLQVSIFNGSTNFVVGNAAEAESKGFEIESAWAATDILTLNASIGYLDAKYTSFPGAGCYYEQRASAPAGAPCTQDLTGQETPYSSKWSGTVGAQVVQPVGDYLVTARVDSSFRSKYNPSTNNDPVVDQDGVAIWDARLQFEPQGGNWTVALFGKNITDELYTDQTSDTPLITGSRFATLNRTAQVGLQLGVKF